MPATPTERTLHAKVAAHAKWSKTADLAAATAPARRAFDERFEREVDPDGQLSADERARRADHARRAYFARLALRSAQSRRKAAALTTEAEAAEAELEAAGGDRDAASAA